MYSGSVYKGLLINNMKKKCQIHVFSILSLFIFILQFNLRNGFAEKLT